MREDNENGAPGTPGAGPALERGDAAGEASEDRVEVIERAAAIDVAKGFGMVCTRVPGSRPGRRLQKIWRVETRYQEVIALMDHLRAEGMQRLVLESTSDTGVSGTTWPRRPGWRYGWLTPATSSTCRGGARATGPTACGCAS